MFSKRLVARPAGSLSAPISLAAALLAGGAAAGCSQLDRISAMRAFKAANTAYQQQDYRKAQTLYEEAVQKDPNLNQVYFFLANSYDNQFKPSRRGEAENDALLDKAVTNYQLASDRLSAPSNTEDDKKLGKLALEYLVSAYGVDKLNDPAKAEPVLQKMIQLEPNEPQNYFYLARVYEDAGVYPEAEQMLLYAKQAKPNDPTVYTQLAAYYNRQNEFQKTIEALQERAAKEPNNPEAFFTIATYYWDNAQRNFRLTDAEKMTNVERGLEAVGSALKIKGDYMEALVYKGLLLRVQANLEKDGAKQQALIKEANELRDQADAIRKKATGAQ
jgi:tetratricopeptide (TPR) repeat protein